MLAAAALAFLAGCALAAQAAANTRLGTRIGVIPAAMFSALITIALLQLVLAARGDAVKPYAGFRHPPWLWVGGALGALALAALSYAPRRIGVVSAILLVIAGQIVMSLLIDMFGWLGATRAATGPARVVGLGLVVGGSLLALRR